MNRIAEAARQRVERSTRELCEARAWAFAACIWFNLVCIAIAGDLRRSYIGGDALLLALITTSGPPLVALFGAFVALSQPRRAGVCLVLSACTFVVGAGVAASFGATGLFVALLGAPLIASPLVMAGIGVLNAAGCGAPLMAFSVATAHGTARSVARGRADRPFRRAAPLS